MRKERVVGLIGIILLVIVLIINGGIVLGQEVKEKNVCCEQTKSGLFCQDVPESECKPGAKQLPTSCQSTSYCKSGTCYDSNEGTCTDNTPQLVCNTNNGIWNEGNPEQCNLGCCILGDQAAFVTLVRCKKLSSFFGLETNYNRNIKNEVECVLSAGAQEKGACVYEFEFEKVCKFTTRAECSKGIGETGIKGEFFSGKLCSAEELGTKCGPTTQTTCANGKDEVYFVDSCGNPANIYDSGKINDKDYWSNVKNKLEVCNPNSANGDSVTCGNCNYLLGSYCRRADKDTGKPRYGENICADLNCKKTSGGKSYRHGESWCVFKDEGETGDGINSVGSRFYKHICVNGEEVLEQCADFRQEECLEDKIETRLGTFSQAACRVNRWQDCVAQTDKLDCENTDKRDCIWKEGVKLFIQRPEGTREPNGACVPKNPPGLKFWEGGEAQSICSQGNAQCIVTIEQDLFGNVKDIKNKECGNEKGANEKWVKERADVCVSLGDCGPKINWIGETGYKSGYNATFGKLKRGKK